MKDDDRPLTADEVTEFMESRGWKAVDSNEGKVQEFLSGKQVEEAFRNGYPIRIEPREVLSIDEELREKMLKSIIRVLESYPGLPRLVIIGHAEREGGFIRTGETQIIIDGELQSCIEEFKLEAEASSHLIRMTIGTSYLKGMSETGSETQEKVVDDSE